MHDEAGTAAMVSPLIEAGTATAPSFGPDNLPPQPNVANEGHLLLLRLSTIRPRKGRFPPILGLFIKVKEVNDG